MRDNHYPAVCDGSNNGWRARLQDHFTSRAQFLTHATAYNLTCQLQKQWGESAEQIWERNPVVQGSYEPGDFRASNVGDVLKFVIRMAAVSPDRASRLKLGSLYEEARGLVMVLSDNAIDEDRWGDAMRLVEYLGEQQFLPGEVRNTETGARLPYTLLDHMADGNLPNELEEVDVCADERLRDIVFDCRAFLK